MRTDFWLVVILSLSTMLDFAPRALAQDKPRTDLYGDPLPAGAIGRLGTTRLRHGGAPIFAVQFLPDGKTLASLGSDAWSTVRLWDVGTGKERMHFHIEGEANRACFSLDGRFVAVANKAIVSVHELATGKHVRTLHLPPLPGGAFTPNRVHFSSNSRIIAGEGADGACVYLWEMATGQALTMLNLELKKPEFLNGLILSADGNLLATLSGDDNAASIIVWDVASGKQLYALRCSPQCARPVFPREGRTLVDFAPDGKTLASLAEDGKSIDLRDSVTGKPIHAFVHPTHIHSLAFAPDGKTLVAGGSAGKISFWDVNTCKELRSLQGPDGPVSALWFSRDGRLLICSADDTEAGTPVQIWRLPEGKEPFRIVRPYRRGQCIFSPDGTTLAITAIHRAAVRLFDTTNGSERPLLPGHQDIIYGLTIAPNGRQVAASEPYGLIRLWDAVTMKEEAQLSDGAWRRSLAFSADGKTLITNREGGVALWDVATRRIVRSQTNPEGRDRIALSPSGRAGAWDFHDGKLRIFDPTTGKERCTLRKPPWRIRTRELAGVFSPDDRKFAVIDSESGYIKIAHWDLATGRELPPLADLTGDINHRSISYSPDGRLVAGLSKDRFAKRAVAPLSVIHLWEVATGEKCLRIEQPRSSLEVLAFSPDGRQIAVGGRDGRQVGFDSHIRLLDLGTGKEIRRFEGHQATLVDLQFSPDGTRLFSSSHDTTVLIWDVAGLHRAAAVLSPAALDACWADLAGKDAAKAYRAVHILAGSPKQAIPFLSSRLEPIVSVDEKQGDAVHQASW